MVLLQVVLCSTARQLPQNHISLHPSPDQGLAEPPWPSGKVFLCLPVASSSHLLFTRAPLYAPRASAQVMPPTSDPLPFPCMMDSYTSFKMPFGCHLLQEALRSPPVMVTPTSGPLQQPDTPLLHSLSPPGQELLPTQAGIKQLLGNACQRELQEDLCGRTSQLLEIQVIL